MRAKISNFLKRAATFSLSALLLITTPFQSFADGLSGNAGGTSGSGVVTSTGGDLGVNVDKANPANSLGRIGIRLSLVDNNDPSKVISVQSDGTTPQVVDILYTSKRNFVGYTGINGAGGYFTSVDWSKTGFSSVKTQDLMAKNSAGAPNIKWVFFDDVFQTNYFGQGDDTSFAVSSLEPWIIHDGSSFNGTGEEFVDWSRKDDAGNVIIGDNGNLISTSFTINIFGMKTQITSTVNKTTGEVSAEIKNGLQTETIKYPGNLVELVSTVRDQLETLEEYFNSYNAEQAEKVYKNFAYTQGNITALKDVKSPSADSLQSQFNSIESQMTEKFPTFANGYNNVKEEYIRSFVESSGGTYNPGTSDAANSMLDSFESGQAGEGGTQDTANQGVSHIHQLLGLKDNGEYLLQTPSMVQHKAEGWTLNDAEEDWVLLVEPITYLTICKAGSLGRASDAVYGSKLYGTVSNIMDALATMPEFAPYGTSPHFNWKAFKEIWYPLHVSDSGTGYQFANGDRLAPLAEYGLAPGTQYMPNKLSSANRWVASGAGTGRKKCGYAVNVYWGKSGITARTWDGKSSTPSAPPESQKVDPGTGIKIVKWYTAKVTVNDKTYEKVTNVIVSNDNPRRVMVENEGIPDEGSFYLLEKWATGKNDVAPDNGDLDTTFEQYYKQNPGTLGGTEPAEVTVPDDEKVLYLKLVQTDWLKEGDLTIVKVKEPSDGSTPLVETSTTTNTGTYDSTEDGWVT